MEPSEYAAEVGARLRATRMALGLSLPEAQAKSGGRWHKAVIGSYERASRALTVARLAELAEFYSVPVTSLLPGGEPGDNQTALLARAILDAGVASHDGRAAVRLLREMLALEDVLPA